MPHIHTEIDFTVEVFIVHNHRVLLRYHDKYNVWLGAGGHVELNEDPNQTAVREAKEETGLEVVLDDSLLTHREHTSTDQELIPPHFLHRHRIHDHHEHVAHVYFARSKSDSLLNEGREASKAMRWFSAQEIQDSEEITERVRVWALKALEVVQ